MIFFIHFFIYYARKEKTINFASVSNKNLTTINFSAKMKKNFKLLMLTLIMGGGFFASEAMADDLQPIDGVYQIGSAQDLLAFSNVVKTNTPNANAVLTADIDMSGQTWVKIGWDYDGQRFCGTFNGQGHRIKNLTITNGGDKIGLFGCVKNGTIKNLIIDSSCSISGETYVAALIGCCQKTSHDTDGTFVVNIENVGVECNVTGTGANVSAFVGCNFNGDIQIQIRNCYNTGIISGNRESGIFSGWFGNNGDTRVTNCWNTGKLIGADEDKSLGRGISESQYILAYDLNSENSRLSVNKLENYSNDWLTNGTLISKLNLLTKDDAGNHSQGNDLPEYLIDGNPSTKWYSGNVQSSPYIEFHTQSAVYVDGYTLITGNDTKDQSQRNPKSWKLYGKLNAGDDYVVLADVSNNTSLEATNLKPYDFSITTPGKYQYFKFEVLASGGYNDFQLSELQLHGDGIWRPSIATSGQYPTPIFDVPTEDNNTLLISNADQLKGFAVYVNSTYRGSFNAKLTNDIDFSGKDAVTFWTPIGNDSHRYQGTFDGQGHTINNFKITTSNDNIGLFGIATGGAHFKNFIIGPNSQITGHRYCAALLGTAKGSGEITIDKVGNESKIYSYDINGNDNNGQNMAAFVGVCDGGQTKITITDCYNTGEIHGHKESAIICGWFGSNSTVTNFFNSGTVEGVESSDNTQKTLYRNSATLTRVYNTLDGQGNKIQDGELENGKICYLLNNSSSENPVWYQTLGTDNYPVPFGTGHKVVYYNTDFYANVGKDSQDGYFVIANADDLEAFAYTVNNGHTTINGKLTADIDMTGHSSFPGIGTSSNRFHGIFDGQKHIISNLNMNITDNGVGFFRYVTGGTNGTTIKRFTIDSSCSFKGNDGVGAFVGQAENGGSLLLEELGNEANVTGNKNAAGILGVVMNSSVSITMKNCYNTGNISSTANSAPDGGALSGWLGNNPTVYNCYNTGEIVGGSKFARSSSSGGTIANCFTSSISDYSSDYFGPQASDDAENFQNGTVLAALFDYTHENPAVDGNVWRMEFDLQDNPTHPVLYEPAMVVLKDDFPNRPVARDNATVKVVRSFVKENWNTVCLPFDMTAAQIASIFGNNSKVAALVGENGTTLKFSTSEGIITAGIPYLVYPTNDNISAIEISNVNITATAPAEDTDTYGGYYFKGTFAPTQVYAATDYGMTSDNIIKKANDGTIKGFRAFFRAASTSGARATNFVIDDETTTAIADDLIIDNARQNGSSKVYDLSGRQITSGQLNKGLYIVNGKKVIK